jgi:ribosome biogenesis GTPase
VLLQQLGATAGTFDDFSLLRLPGCILGRVAIVVRDEYRVYAEDGDYRAEASGALLYGALSQGELPAVGDWVALRAIAQGEAILHAVLPRRTKFSRRAAGTREDEQVIAANVDVALIICGLDGDFNLRRMERYLTLVHECGADPVLVLNKSDLCLDLKARLDAAQTVARGIPVVPISSTTVEGIAPLAPYLRAGKTFVLLGSSGVGKSTLLNRLSGEDLQRTSAVRDSDGRGRHTTTRRELIVLPQGAILIDTPGMRELQLWANQESLDQTFDDIAELAQYCRFRDCAHQVEAGCAVRDALASGELAAPRWESYRKLQSEIRRHELLTDKTAALGAKQRLKAIHKAQREIYKMRPK